MSSVHGQIVFGGTFPADIWHGLYAGAGVPCEEFTEPNQKISWAPFYGRYARSSPSDDTSLDGSADEGESSDSPPPGSAAVGGYDPDAYAPGAGQEPYPAPPAPGDVGGGESAGK